MTAYALEVVATVWGTVLVLAVKISGKEGLGKRNIVHPGKTTLRASIAHALLRCAVCTPGDILLDPLCGSGAILVEATWAQAAGRLPRTHGLCGDVDPSVAPMVRNNLAPLRAGAGVDFLPVDCCRLPFRTGAIDVIVTDLPFGKRIGSLGSVKALYPLILNEMARVTPPGSGRAVLLTRQSKWALQAALGPNPPLWALVDQVRLNHGGLACTILVLRRTGAAAAPRPGFRGT